MLEVWLADVDTAFYLIAAGEHGYCGGTSRGARRAGVKRWSWSCEIAEMACCNRLEVQCTLLASIPCSLSICQPDAEERRILPVSLDFA